jgi:hypothetical protein
VAAGATAVREAWQAAGKAGKPRVVALNYFSLGEGAEALSRRNLRDYYAFLGDFAEVIADSASRSPEDARERMQGFEAAGVDELVFTPSVARLDQVDLLADAVL